MTADGRGRPAWDVVVAGGGPVGLAAAIHATRHGLRVVVVEPRRTPIDKACGEGLMPTALAELARLGVDPPGRDFVGIRYVDAVDGYEVAAEFPGPAGRGVRRTALHQALSDQARCSGVSLLNERVVDVGWDAHRVAVSTSSRGRLTGRYLIAADGLHSRLRRLVGLERPRGGARRFGLRQHFVVEPWDDHVQVHWAVNAEAYVTPVGEACVGVALLTSERASFETLLDSFTTLRRELADAQPAGPVRGAGPLRQTAVSPQRGRVLLVGDAAGYVDALTGEGFAVGLTSARLALEAIATGDTAGYARRWQRATLRSRLLTEAMLRAATTPRLRQGLVRRAAAHPALFTHAVRALA